MVKLHTGIKLRKWLFKDRSLLLNIRNWTHVEFFPLCLYFGSLHVRAIPADEQSFNSKVQRSESVRGRLIINTKTASA